MSMMRKYTECDRLVQVVLDLPDDKMAFLEAMWAPFCTPSYEQMLAETKSELEAFVMQYGEQYRTVIATSLEWLDDAHRPIDHKAFIERLIARTQGKVEKTNEN